MLFDGGQEEFECDAGGGGLHCDAVEDGGIWVGVDTFCGWYMKGLGSGQWRIRRWRSPEGSDMEGAELIGRGDGTEVSGDC